MFERKSFSRTPWFQRGVIFIKWIIFLIIPLAIISHLFGYNIIILPDGVTDLDLTHGEVFEESNALQLEQDDLRLLNYIRKHYLIPPSTEPYNLKNPNDDPSRFEGQNKYIMDIFNYKRDGFFVESGAWDGEQLSTTLVLERDYGWRGLLVEPNSKSFSQLLSKNRKAWTANICLSPVNHPQLVDFGEVPLGVWWYPAISAIKKHLTVGALKVGTMKKKPCFPIFSVLAALNVTTVDFFSLDIEGAELDVLKTIPFDKILIKTFAMEWNHVPEGKYILKQFVESKGYRLIKDLKRGSASDFIFAHQSLFSQPMS